ncbi:hypothetical protein Pmar_PMAR001167 [Perkinsus marinus ATCC 50983]|uniref:U1-type domain-containing protein n=1 Tax=Perkinsus marinus (strain ATCC 50983 / TXsc) TaxID=423536 RepID=C5KT18_PERM5|nr:hypothetical protein Pmar_PMAR001167 [Perkinsus marinus ATCC 50983]EER12368.1 hypothetical protein Pmar_PMAR001167 [Perkinsus marinus ATCC 50983]|eukprot:XP_002780573.1 hypothetical protein Pmar_PMAR001167 [Perkinsus marinus ATCC 50983]
MPSIGDSGGGGGQGGHWSGEQDAPRSVLLSAAHSMTGGGLKTEPPTEGEDYSPADGPEKEPPTEQEIAVQEKGRPAAPKVKEEKGQKDDEKPDASSWGNSGKWGEKSTTGSRALGGSLWKGTWDPDRRSNDKGPPAGKRNCSSPSWDVPPDWDPQKEYDALPASQRAILENNFIGLSDGKKYYGLEKGWLYCELCRKKTCISFDFMSVHLQSEKHQRNVRWMQMQSDESRMKAIEDISLTNSPSKEELSAALVPATHSGGGNAHVIKQEDLPKFIELRPDCFYCTLCDARPQAWASLEGHIAGQRYSPLLTYRPVRSFPRHRSRYERAEWEQSDSSSLLGISGLDNGKKGAWISERDLRVC